MVELVARYGVTQLGFLIAVMLLVFVLGMFLETISIIVDHHAGGAARAAALQINPVWYGILLTINLELALITPPVGMNLFAIKAITRVPIREIIVGVTPDVGLLILGLALVLLFPQIALWLPGTMNTSSAAVRPNAPPSGLLPGNHGEHVDRLRLAPDVHGLERLDRDGTRSAARVAPSIRIVRLATFVCASRRAARFTVIPMQV